MLSKPVLFLLASICAFCSSIAIVQLSHAEEKETTEKQWTLLTAPGAWEDQDVEKLEEYDGYAWYRCYIKVPDNWVTFKDEIEEFGGSKNLYAQSVTIITENVGNAHEIYLNGQKIGNVGKLPPNYESNSSYQRTKIPPKLLKKGYYNTLAIRVYNKKGKGGFLFKAPVMAGYFKECVLKNEWEFQTGDNMKWAVAAIDTKPDHAAYDQFREATSQLSRPDKFITGERLSPNESMTKMTVDDDLTLDQLLTEPLVAQPTSMFFDERGRLWVTQYRQYPYPAGMKIVSRDRYYRAVYDRKSPPPPNHFKGMDRISIHEDTNGDGKYDKHKTFVDDLNIAITAAKGRGGIWVLNSPYLLFYPDKNNDDIPDAVPEVHLEGFGLDDTHAIANGLRWGPDGWLYWIQGSTVSSRVKLFGASDKTLLYCEGKGTWRYHPETKRVELFNEGGYNGMGVDFDGQGRLLGGLNAGMGRVIHEVQGGYYNKGASSKYGPVSNPYVFGEVPVVLHETKMMRFDHSVIKYESTELPKRFHNQIVSIDPLHQNAFLTKIEPLGSTFKTRDIGEPLQSTDIGFRPVMIKQGPDGGIYVADFYEEFIAHGQHYQGQLDPSTGRIYRIRSKEKYSQPAFDYTKKSSDELVDLLTHTNKWHRHIALRLIGDKKDKSISSRLHKIMRSNTDQKALEAFWAINLIGEFEDALAAETLKHTNPMIRMWTVRLLCDEKSVSPQILDLLATLAHNDKNPEVRRQLASSAARLKGEDCLKILAGLLTHDEDVEDRIIPLMIWWALESKAAKHRTQIVEIFSQKKSWNYGLVRNFMLERLSRRYAAAGGRSDLLACATLLSKSPDDETRKSLLKGFELAFKGRTLGAIPKELAKELTANGGGSIALRMRLGDEAAIESALNSTANPKTRTTSKTELIQILGELNESRALPIFEKLLKQTSNEPLQIQLLSSLQNYEEPKIADWVISNYNPLSLDSKEVAQTLLSSRKPWSKALLAAVDRNDIDPKKISADTARKMTLHQDEMINELVAKHWEETQNATNEELQVKIAHFNEIIKAGKGGGNPYSGKAIYKETCAKCHRLFTDGRNVGPNLTSYKRDDPLRMLLHIVNPSAEIREGYENYLVMTKKGRVSTGFIIDQDKKIVVIRGADGQNATIPRDDIMMMDRQPKSIMPDGLLDKMTEEQIRDLFAYLRKSQPIGNKQ